MRSGVAGILRAFVTLAVAIVAGWLCDAAGLPLGWLIGAMLVMIAASLLRFPAEQPTPVIPYVKASVGTLLGASVSAGVILSIPDWWVSLSAMFAVMIVAGLINFGVLRRAFGFSPADAALCSMPGGIAEMIFLSEAAGADQRRVAIVHAVRIAFSILAIPVIVSFLYGIEVDRAAAPEPAPMSAADWFWFGLCILSGVAAQRWASIPLPLILAPLALSAGLHVIGVTDFEVPGAVSKAMQIVIGLNVGARFEGIAPSTLGKFAGVALFVVVIQIALAIVAAVVVAVLPGFDTLALTLAFAPGGLAEMSLIAIAMGRDVAFVGFHHILRVLFALSLAPLLLRRISTREAT